MKVKITNSSHWHTGMVGQEFNVRIEPNYAGYVYVTDPGSYLGNGLLIGNYVHVSADPAAEATKIVTHEGITCSVHTRETWA